VRRGKLAAWDAGVAGLAQDDPTDRPLLIPASRHGAANPGSVGVGQAYQSQATPRCIKGDSCLFNGPLQPFHRLIVLSGVGTQSCNAHTRKVAARGTFCQHLRPEAHGSRVAAWGIAPQGIF